MTTPLVCAIDVSKTFGRGERAVVAVHGLNVEVPPGARLAVTGPSGSGKSTLVHLLAGLERPTTGQVSWPGLTHQAMPATPATPATPAAPAARPVRRIGLVFQGPSLLPPLDVLENVALPLLIDGVPDRQAQRRAHAALRILDLDDLATKLPEEISGGQAQRVAVARALATEPDLVMADEPTGQLDHETAGHVIDVLLAAVDRLGAALVVATHDPSVVGRLHTRWLVHDGTVTTFVPSGQSTTDQPGARS